VWALLARRQAVAGTRRLPGGEGSENDDHVKPEMVTMNRPLKRFVFAAAAVTLGAWSHASRALPAGPSDGGVQNQAQAVEGPVLAQSQEEYDAWRRQEQERQRAAGGVAPSQPAPPATGQAKHEFESFDPRTLDPAISEGIFAAEMARLGGLSSLPFVRLDADATVELPKDSDLRAFAPAFEVIENLEKSAGGTFDLTLLLGLVDEFSRVDASINRIIYDVKKPDPTTLRSIGDWLYRSQAPLSTGSPGTSDDGAKALLSEFQRMSGLAESGVLDDRTAKEIAKQYSLLLIHTLESYTFYPDDPQHVVFILPYELLLEIPMQLSGGFKDFEDVERRAFNIDEFRGLKQIEGIYIAFVYFLDKVDPARSIQIGFTNSTTARPNRLTPKRYGRADEWPVVAETFQVAKTASRDLYLKVVIDGEVSASHRLSQAR